MTEIHSGSDLLRLWKFCEKFVKKEQINSSETIYQSDNVIINAYEFIEGICEIVGYNKDL